MEGDGARAPGNGYRRSDAGDLIDQQHHVCGFGRRRSAARAHRQADIGRGERGRVVDAVADHHHRAACALGEHDLDLFLRLEIGADKSERQSACDELGNVGAVAGGENDALNAEPAKFFE